MSVIQLLTKVCKDLRAMNGVTLFVTYLLFVNSITITYISSFNFLMIEHFGLITDRSQAGYYVSYMSSAFYIGRIFSASYWGYFIDTHGRRVGLLLTLVLVAISNLVFGLSPNIIIATIIRLLLGLLNGISPICKALTSEIHQSGSKETRVAFVNTLSHAGSFLGPYIAAMFVNYSPTYPFFFCGAAVAGFVVVALILSYFLVNETLDKTNRKSAPIENGKVLGKVTAATANSTNDNSPQTPATQAEKIKEEHGFFDFKEWKRILCLPNVMLLLLLNGTYSLYNSVNNGVIPLFLAAPINKGGVGMDSVKIGEVQVSFVWIMIIFQLVLYSSLTKYFTQRQILYAGYISKIPAFLALPLLTNIRLWLPDFWWKENLMWVLCGLAIISNHITGLLIYSPSMFFLNESVDTSERGRINGINMMVSSLASTFGYLIFNNIFAWSLNSNAFFPFNYFLVFLICAGSSFAFSFLPAKISKIKNY